MTSKTRKKKESFVVFEDWMRYARCLNDTEFRQLMTNILNYCKGQEPVLNTSMLQEVWNDIIDDLEINVNKKQAKRDTMLKNSLSNSKLSIVSNIKPDIGSDISSNIISSTGGMVDGICDMEDSRFEIQNEYIRDEQMSNVYPDVYIHNDTNEEMLKRHIKNHPKIYDTSSIPGRFKPDDKIIDLMFGPEAD